MHVYDWIIHLNPQLPNKEGFRSLPFRFLAHNFFFGMDLREMLTGVPGQMMDTCYGENRMKISPPYPKKNFRITKYAPIFDNIW